MAESGHERDLDDLRVDLGRRVRAARTLSGKKVPELAHDLGWRTERVYRTEQGKSFPDAFELARIAEATGQPIDFFYEGITSPAAEAEVLTHSDPRSQEERP